jgi:oligoendopeptidase F
MTNQTAVQLTGAEDITWDLTDLYNDVTDPAIDRDLTEADTRADTLAESYHGRVANLDAEEMRDLLEEFEAIQDKASRVAAYAFMHWSTNTQDSARGALLQKATERTSRLGQKLLFLQLEWANTPDDHAQLLMNNPILQQYYHWLEMARRYRPFLLSEPEERILAEKAITGREAWGRFFDEVHSNSLFDWDGAKIPQSALLGKLYDPDRSVRSRISDVLTEELKKLAHTTTYIYNNILADKASDDTLRGYPSWVSARNMANEVDDESVEALVRAVTSRYDIVARYYKLKKRLLGLDELFDYDRYAPLPAAPDRPYSWNEAKEIVLNAFGKFHPTMEEIAQEFFDKNWIDAPIVQGKRGGAYCHPVAPSAHPYLLLNFEGKARDVQVMAHEMGHGIHGYLSRQQGLLHSDTPITTAETASVFGEMLVFQDLLSRETDPEARLSILTTKIENDFATVFRQMAMNRFENAIHTARRNEGELTTERFNELWLEVQRAMFTDSVIMTDNYGLWWSYIPHMVHTPGYVYGYTFGNLLVLALYARYQEVGESFAGKYLDMLAAGGSDWPHELVKPLGVDLTDPNFWKQGMQILESWVAEAELLAEKIGK